MKLIDYLLKPVDYLAVRIGCVIDVFFNSGGDFYGGYKKNFRIIVLLKQRM